LTGTTDSFEVHASQDGRWSLAEVHYDQAAAVARAAVMALEPHIQAARVVWSRFDAVADTYTERTIFKRSNPESPAGAQSTLLTEPEEDTGCRTGAELYRPEARMAIHRALAAELDRRRITVLELLHDWQHARALYDASNVLQGAVQRHVLETARAGGQPASMRIKRLYDVVDEAKLALHKLAHAPGRPLLERGGLGPMVEAWADAPDGERMIFSALAEYLRPAEDWRDKLARLAEAISPEPRAAELRFVDELTTEILGAKRGLAAFIGGRKSGVDVVMALISVVDASEDDDTLTAEAASLRHAAGGIANLPALRSALARRARRIVESGQYLGADGVTDEVHNIGALWRAVDVTAPDGVLRRLQPALERRAIRQMSAERLGVMLARIQEPWARVERLIELEINVVGDEAKLALGKYLHTVLADRAAPPALDDRTENAAVLLRRLRRWQIQVRDSGFAPTLRDELMKLIDRHSVRLITERRLVDALARRHPVPWEQALALMELVLTDHFTEGDALRLAKDRMLLCLKSNGGLQALNEAMRASDQLATKGRVMYDFLAASRAAAQ
jgi:hypothetical protein